MLANRLEEATYLIGKDQTGFIRGRNMSTNIKKTMEIISHLNSTQKPGIIIIIDFEKCFDRIEYASIRGVFEFYGFGESFIQMLFLLFNDFKLRTQSSGFTSDYFEKTRGVNQGCCASPLIYSYCSAIIQHLVYSESTVEGLDLHGVKNVLSQFVDDTAAFLKYSRIELEQFTNILTHVEALMGLKVSYEKTTIYRIGSLQNSAAEIYTQKNFVWSSGPIETLGVMLNMDGSACTQNFEEIKTKMLKVCNCWANRQLTKQHALKIGWIFKIDEDNLLSECAYRALDPTLRSWIWRCNIQKKVS